jgi:hypothetical protein
MTRVQQLLAWLADDDSIVDPGELSAAAHTLRELASSNDDPDDTTTADLLIAADCCEAIYQHIHRTMRTTHKHTATTVTDHAKREAALAYAVTMLRRAADTLNLPNAVGHANYLADILHDHRNSNPEFAASLAREWADATIDGWRSTGD